MHVGGCFGWPGHFEGGIASLSSFSHLLTPIACISTNKLGVRSWYIFQKQIFNVPPLIIGLNKFGWHLAWVYYGFSGFIGPLTFRLYFQPNCSTPVAFTINTNSNHFPPKNFHGSKKIKFDHIFTDWNPRSLCSRTIVKYGPTVRRESPIPL